MIDLEIDGAVATVTLSASPLNALTPDLVARLGEVLDRIERDDTLGVARIRSAARVFCAGADLAFMSANFATAPGRKAIHAFVAAVQKVYYRIEALPIPTIAQIAGPAVGGGLELALSCDFRVIADTASVALPEVNIGLIPGAGGTQRLTRFAGPAVARRLILVGRPIGAAEAVQLGICDWVRPAAELDAWCDELCSHFAGLPRDALGACKRCIDAAGDPQRNGFQEELDATAALLESDSTQRRVRAFLARGKSRPTGTSS